MSQQLFVGVDVSKAELVVHILPAGKSFTVTNDDSGHQKLIAELRQRGDAHVVLEASGGYEKLIYFALHDADIKVTRVEPKRARRFAEAIGQNAKNDKVDAAMLAQMVQKLQPDPDEKPSPEADAMAELVARRRQLVELEVSERLRLQTARRPAIKENIESVLKSIKDQIEHIETEIGRHISECQELADRVERLREVPGIGPIVSATLVSEFPELGKLTRREAASLAGVAPHPRESGNMRGKRFIRGGRASVRRALYQAVMSARRFNPLIMIFWDRLKAAGKPHRVAMVACARKLLIILNAMLREGIAWNPFHQLMSKNA